MGTERKGSRRRPLTIHDVRRAVRRMIELGASWEQRHGRASGVPTSPMIEAEEETLGKAIDLLLSDPAGTPVLKEGPHVVRRGDLPLPALRDDIVEILREHRAAPLDRLAEHIEAAYAARGVPKGAAILGRLALLERNARDRGSRGDWIARLRGPAEVAEMLLTERVRAARAVGTIMKRERDARSAGELLLIKGRQLPPLSSRRLVEYAVALIESRSDRPRRSRPR